MKKTIMEQAHRIACEIFTLVKIPPKHESIDIMRVGIEYLLRWGKEADRNVLYLRNLFIRELCHDELFILLKEKTGHDEATMEEDFLREALKVYREKPDYEKAVCDCIIDLEYLWLQGMHNEFEQKFDGLLAKNIVRNEVFVPYGRKRPEDTVHISVKGRPV